MDFTSRHSQPERSHSPAPAAGGTPAATSVSSSRSSSDKRSGGNAGSNMPQWLRVAYTILLFVVVFLVAAVLLLLYTARPQSEKKYINSSHLQAVFLNTNQVYFGKIGTINDKYLVLTDIFYLQTSSTSATSSSSVSLVKLGCELHRPYDKMVINRSEVTFWENIKDDSQVASAVAKFQKANPNGQKCSDQTQTQSTSGSNVQGGSSSGTGTTGTGSSTGTGTTGTTKP